MKLYLKNLESPFLGVDMKWKHEIRHFIKNTSIKGFKRVTESELTAIKCLWSISIILLFIVASYQSYSVLNNFFSYQTTTVVFQEPGISSEFPAITICNINPFSWTGEQNYTIYLTHLFLDMFDIVVNDKEFVKTLASLKLDNQTLTRILFNNILSAKGFFIGLSPNDTYEQGHSFEKLFLDCEYLQYSGLLDIRKSCKDVAKIKLTSHPKYVNCYTLEVQKFQSSIDALIISVFLYNKGQNLHSKYTQFLPRPYGAKVAAHPPNTFVNIEEAGITVPSGQSATIQLIPEEIIRQGQPYGNCVSEDNSPYPNLVDLDRKSLKYNYQACLFACFQKELVRKCRCADPSLYVYSSKEEAEEKFCQKLTKDSVVKDVIQAFIDLNCTYSNINGIEKCLDHCYPPCSEIKWDMRFSSAHWPSNKELFTTYNMIELLKRDDIFEEYNILEHLQKLQENRQFLEGNELLKKADFLQENIIRIKFINVGKHGFKKSIESPKYQTADVISKLGGLLNLWCGLSVVFFIELFELILRLFSTETNKTATNMPIAKIGRDG